MIPKIYINADLFGPEINTRCFYYRKLLKHLFEMQRAKVEVFATTHASKVYGQWIGQEQDLMYIANSVYVLFEMLNFDYTSSFNEINRRVQAGFYRHLSI